MIRVFEPHITLKDKFSVIKTLFKNNISGTSPVVSEFEELSSKNVDQYIGDESIQSQQSDKIYESALKAT